MAWCLTAPSHYLNQWWLEIIVIHPSAIFRENVLDMLTKFISWSFLDTIKNTSVLLVVCPSVTHFSVFLTSYHHEIFSSYYHWQKRCPCKRSRSDVKGQGYRSKQILPQFGHLRTVTPVWIDRCLRYDAQSLQWHRRGALLFFEIISSVGN